jgi:hypothetical protein
MRWLKHTISVLMLLAAVGVILATAFSDHSDDYGQVALPQGGTLHLPKGSVTVFYHQLGDNSDPIRQVNGGLAFQVTPAAGGPPVAMTLDNGQTSGVAVQRSETIGELGAVAKLDVPSSGNYVVTGSTEAVPGSSYLQFGTNAGSAVLHRWKLLVGLIVGAILIAMIPVPRSGRRWEDPTDEPTGWSSDPRAPYAG